MAVRPLARRPSTPLNDHGLVGDGRSAALVTSEGTVVWWCPERFDGPSVFAGLLDPAGGHFSTGMPVPHRRETGYDADTNVHVTDLVTSDARVRVTTAMAHVQAGHPDAPPCLVRHVSSRGAEVDVTFELAPRYPYGKAAPAWRQRDAGLEARFDDGAALWYQGDVRLEPQGDGAAATVRMRDGQEHTCVLSWGRPADLDVVQVLRRERGFWKDWIDRCTYEGAYRDEVRRGLLALKLLQHAPTGTFVAAATTSLPEWPGAARNWDYRYSWLRDGAFIVMAFETMGFDQESDRFREWLADLLADEPPEQVQMMYRVDHGRDLEESDLDHLAGYLSSRPVRVGNDAAGQYQMDTFGEMMMCFHRANGLFRSRGQALWGPVRRLVEATRERWRDDDAGIWEMRGDQRPYVHSKALAALAIEHGIDIAEKHGYDAPLDDWRRDAAELRAYLMEHGRRDGGFVQSVGRADADAALLLLGILGFIEPDDASMVATVARVERDLVGHGLVHRYVVDDQQETSEGAFLPASFWLAHVLALQGRVEDARAYFDTALSVAGPCGLLPEEADPVSRAPLGNLPQALTHLALVNAAWAIDAAEHQR